MSPGSGIPIVDAAARHARRLAIADEAGEHTYAGLRDGSSALAASLLADAASRPASHRADLGEARVAFMVPPGVGYATALWAIWRAGGIAVPLCTFHPTPELEYVLEDADGSVLLGHPSLEAVLRPLARARGLRYVSLEEVDRTEAVSGSAGPSDQPMPEDPPDTMPAEDVALPRIDPARRALILYTSGTTSRPKGVVMTHAALAAQVESLVEAWGWTAGDRILHTLPLHHTHGIVNALLCALQVGATCEMMPRFEAEAVWNRFVRGVEGPHLAPITLFMAVPTVYVKLIAAWDAAPPARREAFCAAARSLRLMVSGSAALPVRVFERWREIGGRPLLERYGMTEIGMGLSNPLKGERRPGTVGRPLPGVRVRLVDESGAPIAEEGVAGEIEVRGPGLFLEYWRRPEATRRAFHDGWFRTGDVALVEDGYYRILGRRSVDIIKTGGYKVSALEIEEALREHPEVADCAVVGAEDSEWGERVCAVLVPAEGLATPGAAGGPRPDRTVRESPAAGLPGAASLPDRVDAWARERLAPYKVPRRWLVRDELPRNAMGKVLKPEVKALFRVES
ncbi:MAG: acyl-CoA synthetase [Gemmatimonadota bacterium]